MPVSGSYSFDMTRNDIIQAAAEEIGVIGIGMALNADHIDKIGKRLNMLKQQYESKASFAPGSKEWARERGYMFLQKGQVEYDLGPAATDDNWTLSYVTTTGTAAEPAAETNIAVTAITGISSADIFGIELTDGSIHWDTVNGAPAALTVVITNGIPAGKATAVGARVFAYTTRAQRPNRILYMSRRNTDGEDTTMGEIRELSEYEAISDKDSEGTPASYLSEARVENYRVLLDQAPDDRTDVMRITFHRPLSDFDAAANTPDFPNIWNLPLVLNTAILSASVYRRPVSEELKNNAAAALAIASHEYAEVSDVMFEPGKVY